MLDSLLAAGLRAASDSNPNRQIRRLVLSVHPVILHAVWGSGDPALGPRAAITTGRWITGAFRFEILAGAGHWLPEHHAGELGRLLLEHLRRWKTRPTAAGGRAR